MRKCRLLPIIILLVCASVLAVYCFNRRPVDLTSALSIEFNEKVSNGGFSLTIYNHSDYDVDIFYDWIYFPGVICVNSEDGSIRKYMDGRCLNILRTSTVDARQVRILKNSGFTQELTIENMELIHHDNSGRRDAELAWVEIGNLTVDINSRPNIRILMNVKSDKISSETELGAVLQGMIKK